MQPDWRPKLDANGLRRRGAALADIRRFFADGGVLEVDTPVLAPYGVTDPHLGNLTTHAPDGTWALQTSPESAMKRCLAAGSGPIYQLGPAFRDDPSGRLHRSEFTLLEWYRPGFRVDALMREVEALVRQLASHAPAATALDYGDCFLRYCGVAHDVGTVELRQCAEQHGLNNAASWARAELIDWLFSCCVQAQLPGLCFVVAYPADQAVMATLDPNKPGRSTRFELFWDGVELANGWVELADAAEQAQRFDEDNARREALGLPSIPVDELLLAALRAGLPPCAGVALGVDRLLMQAWGADSLAAVRPFSDAPS
ncbi:EF-P lysine aminoacylase GenX [bacterium]|nr:EF-P lysine aminoacylase GenX [bacterium]